MQPRGTDGDLVNATHARIVPQKLAVDELAKPLVCAH